MRSIERYSFLDLLEALKACCLGPWGARGPLPDSAANSAGRRQRRPTPGAAVGGKAA